MALSMIFPHSDFPLRPAISRRRHHHHHPLFTLDLPSTALSMHSAQLQCVRRAFDMASDDTMPSDDPMALCQSSYTATTDKHATTVEVDLPGVPKHEVSIELKGRKLVVTGRRNPKSHAHPTTLSNDDTMADTDAHVTKHNASPATPTNPTGRNTEPESAAPATPATPATVVHDEAGPESHIIPNDENNAHINTDHNGDSHNKGNNDKNDNTDDRRPRAVVYKTVLHLGPQVDTELITVPHFRDGVLTLRLPHRKPSETRRIMIE